MVGAAFGAVVDRVLTALDLVGQIRRIERERCQRIALAAFTDLRLRAEREECPFQRSHLLFARDRLAVVVAAMECK